MRALRSAPRAALDLLGKRLKPTVAPKQEHVARLLRDLGSERFAVRRAAQEELEKLGSLAGPALKQARAAATSLEARRRLDQLIDKLDGPATEPELVRALRAVELLEHLPGRGGEKLLQTLAGGAAEARLTREAKRALERLSAGRKQGD
jgi:hypothetical protein